MGRPLFFLTALLATTTLVGCSSDAAEAREPASGAAAAETVAGPFTTGGVIQAVAEDGSRASIAHEDVPDYMPAMTMPFFAGEPGQLEGLSEGDRVSLRFERRGDGKHYLLSIAAVE